MVALAPSVRVVELPLMSIPLCAHLGFQFQEFPEEERFAQAARAGFRGVEWPNPYAHPPARLRRWLDTHGLHWTQLALPMGQAGEKGLTALPGREAEFRAGLQQAIEYALVLGARWLHPMAGKLPPGLRWEDPAVQHTYLNNVAHTVHTAAQHGLGTLVEVIAEAEVPGYALCTYERAEEVLTALAPQPPFLLLDAYHAQLLTGDAIAVARRFAGRIGHVQIADHPGRHEPGTGTINFDALFATLQAGGYHGWAGCEYRPATTTLDGLHHLSHYLEHPANDHRH